MHGVKEAIRSGDYETAAINICRYRSMDEAVLDQHSIELLKYMT